jgi:hypothetical protein
MRRKVERLKARRHSTILGQTLSAATHLGEIECYQTVSARLCKNAMPAMQNPLGSIGILK